MPQTPEGKTRKDWYIADDVVEALRERCHQERKKESHVVEEALRAMLDLPSPTPA